MNNLPVVYNPYKIYIHISPSGGVYIGQTKNEPIKRWGIKGSGYRSQPFYKTIIKYGWDNMMHIILYKGLTKELADEFEISLIKSFKTIGKCYNITDGGEGFVGIESWAKGKHLSSEHKLKISKSHFGITPNEETRKKMSEAKKGKTPWNKGKKASDETKKKLSESHKGHVPSNKGIPTSKDVRKKLSESHKGQIPWNKKTVGQYSKDLQLIKTWDSSHSAGNELGLNSSSIRRCCLGQRKSYKGYIWKYVD